MDKEIEVEVEAASGRKDPGWKYARLLNEKDTNTLICIFCDKVTKGDIYRQKQHLVGGFRNSKKCTRCVTPQNPGVFFFFSYMDPKEETRQTRQNVLFLLFFFYTKLHKIIHFAPHTTKKKKKNHGFPTHKPQLQTRHFQPLLHD